MSDLKERCACGGQISHKNVRMCSLCYRNKRRLSAKLNEQLRNQADPQRKEKILKLRSEKHKNFRQLNPILPKKCQCGQNAMKGSRYTLCKDCSMANRKIKKVKYQTNRKKNHLPSRLRENIKSRLKRAIQNPKSNSIVKYLDCSMAFYVEYLESKFTTGMTWENYGTDWHIDHIIPLSSNYEDLSLHHYTNTQPIWIREHLSKTANENKKQRV